MGPTETQQTCPGKSKRRKILAFGEMVKGKIGKFNQGGAKNKKKKNQYCNERLNQQKGIQIVCPGGAGIFSWGILITGR